MNLQLKGAYSRNNLPKINHGAYRPNLDGYKSIGAHWIALHKNSDNLTYFDSSGFENIQKEIKKVIDNKNITTNIYRIQVNDQIMIGYICIGFIDFMLKG